MKKILVPTDFSKPAMWALEMAIKIAKRAKGQIVLLHIVEQPSSESFNVGAQVSIEEDWEDRLFTLKLIERNKIQLAEAARIAEDAGVPVTRELRLGNSFHGIAYVISEHEVDLVVMGTSGRSQLEEMMVGSNTERVVRFAKFIVARAVVSLTCSH